MKSFILELVFKGLGLVFKIYIKYERMSQAVGGFSQEQYEQGNNEIRVTTSSPGLKEAREAVCLPVLCCSRGRILSEHPDTQSKEGDALLYKICSVCKIRSVFFHRKTCAVVLVFKFSYNFSKRRDYGMEWTIFQTIVFTTILRQYSSLEFGDKNNQCTS